MADFGISEVAYFAMAATAASAAVGAYSSYESGVAQRNAAMYQAAVAKNNQIYAEQYAQAATARGQRLEDAKRLETAQREGAVKAAAAANGLDVDSGSPLRLQEDTAKLGEYDALTIRDAASREAYGYRIKGSDYAAQAQLDEMRGADASRAGALGAFSSIIGGASSVSGKWVGFKQQGVSPFSGG